MDTIVAMRDIRQSLAAIADRAEKGETFVVIRKSRPVFRIEPATGIYGSPARTALATVREVRERFATAHVSRAELSPDDLDRIIREVRRETRPETPAG